MTPGTRRITGLLGAAALLALPGCSLMGTTTGRVLYSEGCVLYIDGFVTAQTEKFIREWDLSDECDVKIITSQDDVESE